MLLLAFLKVNLIVQILIIAFLVILFLVLTILNYRTKAPKGENVNEKCINCTSLSCIIKIKDAEKIKEEMKKELLECKKNKENKNE